MGNYSSHKLGRKCSRCEASISDANKTGMCRVCYPKYGLFGANNPFYGRKHTEETKKKIVEASRENTRALWKNLDYREKVIANATGLHRSEQFRKEQSIRTKASYDKTEGLREQRGKLFSLCWKDGRNHFRVRKNKKSREEKEIYEYLKALGKYIVSDDEVCIGGNKFLAPDMIINGKVIVEFYGDYFHANPLVYKPEEYIVKKEKTARQLWEEDSNRQKMLAAAGYFVIVVWQSTFRHNKKETLTNLVKEIDSKLKGETV